MGSGGWSLHDEGEEMKDSMGFMPDFYEVLDLSALTRGTGRLSAFTSISGLLCG